MQLDILFRDAFYKSRETKNGILHHPLRQPPNAYYSAYRKFHDMAMLTIAVILQFSIMGVPNACYEADDMPEATAEALPRWRGFNLLDKFVLEWSPGGPFQEKDFKLISEFGFNFVRLPMDYRFWIVEGNWETFNEAIFADLDQALEFGARYGIHVCMNFHRAPGYTVAKPPEPTNLWEDEETQRVCAMHWRYFAARYKGIPNRLLSFNLFNEPADISGEVYAAVVKKMVEAIRAEDPDRLIIADGLDWGNRPCRELVPLGIAQAARGYQPSGLTHYMASWFEGADQWPLPEWPKRIAGGGFLYGPYKSEMKSPIEINSCFTEPATLVITVGEVSSHTRLVVTGNGKEIYAESFSPGPGEGPWEKSVFLEQYNSYRASYNKEIQVPVPAGEHKTVLDVDEGDWLTITRLEIRKDDHVCDCLSVIPRWGEPNPPIKVDSDTMRFQTTDVQDAAWLWDTYFKHWAQLREEGTGVMVGEWGAYNKTPHDVTLRWMEDSLKAFRRAGLGWALWNFRGPLGVIDSERDDVEYEPFEGHLLDRKMLDLLQRY
jgi:hypothetical protein